MQYVRLVLHQLGSGYVQKLFAVLVPSFHETFAFFETVKETAPRSGVAVLVGGTANANSQQVRLKLFRFSFRLRFFLSFTPCRLYLPIVHKVHTRRYHFDSFELVAGRPGHHVDAEFHAGRDVEKKRRSAVHVQLHRPFLVHRNEICRRRRRR